jgi:Zn-dependent M28 family amino/carboxypeptidase
MLEMARIFSNAGQTFPETLIFIAYSGEEQGLYGSEAHAEQMVDEGKADSIIAAHIMDMVAYWDVDSPNPAVLLETSSSFQDIQEVFSEAAVNYGDGIEPVLSLNPFGSDHVPYIDRGIASLLTIDNDWDSYADYHRTTDTPDKVNQTIAVQILKTNIAAIYSLISKEFDGSEESSAVLLYPTFAIPSILLFSMFSLSNSCIVCYKRN